MENITLEQVDKVRERCNVSYAEAKEALEYSEGNILDAIIYLEKKQNDAAEEESDFKKEYSNCDCNGFNSMSIEEIKNLIKNLIEKGNVTRIKIKKNDEELLDIPVNAGIAASVIGIIIPPILAATLIAAIATQITIEITREDGSVEVVNQYVTKMANDVKEKASDFADIVKNKVNEVKNDVKSSKDTDSAESSKFDAGETVYSYTVNFDEDKNDCKEEIKEEKIDEDSKEN
ncbi:DUF4342 domain-containing protein [uncultured Clostridium sp.]|uniref:DUF4342 domain-containing protein n=1 Tax=uncultured Clostridium sp. TaxID=59620 RepID=UPI0025E32D68|nr:DUF4342 domain-containing protein [uncultured Clostridium sp.]